MDGAAGAAPSGVRSGDQLQVPQEATAIDRPLCCALPTPAAMLTPMLPTAADSEQLTEMNDVVAGMDLDNTASLSGNALSQAVGNIGVNIAAGAGNAQHNGLSIAVASCGTCD